MKRILCGFFVLLVAGYAGAQSSASACAGDLRKFCAGGNDVECLLDHYQDISDGCYSALKQQMSANKNTHPGGAAPAAVPATAGTGIAYQLAPSASAAPVVSAAPAVMPPLPVRSALAGPRSGQDARECLRFDDPPKVMACAEQFR